MVQNKQKAPAPAFVFCIQGGYHQSITKLRQQQKDKIISSFSKLSGWCHVWTKWLKCALLFDPRSPDSTPGCKQCNHEQVDVFVCSWRKSFPCNLFCMWTHLCNVHYLFLINVINLEENYIYNESTHSAAGYNSCTVLMCSVDVHFSFSLTVKVDEMWFVTSLHWLSI